uniref:Hyccin n=1 Tax=Chenopodium quinoa TaxID=63459 RepID=A0A803N420_CHEQI
MESWWESVSKARSRIQALLSLLPPFSSSDSLSSLVDSDQPARSLLDSYETYSAVSSALSGSGDDPLCQWLYDTFLQSSDDSELDFRLVVISLVPLIAGLYLSRIHTFSTTSPSALGSPSLAGFEAVLLALYSSEVKARAGKPLLVSIPSPAYLAHHPSLYHTPSPQPHSPPIDLCRFAASWAGSDCPCAHSLDFHCNTPTTTANRLDDDDDAVSVSEDLVVSSTTSTTSRSSTIGGIIAQHPQPHQNGTAGSEIILSEVISRLDINGNNTNHSQMSHSSSSGRQGHGQEQEGVRILLPWELLQPLLRILGHCLLAPAPLNNQEVKDAASVAVRRLYARASHDLAPQAILATRSLVQLDNRARATAKSAALATSSSNANTPKSSKPEVFLVSK